MLGYLAEIEVERDSIATDRLWLSFSGLSDFEPLGGTSADTIFCPPRQAGMRDSMLDTCLRPAKPYGRELSAPSMTDQPYSSCSHQLCVRIFSVRIVTGLL
jgi:hypothetical protein